MARACQGKVHRLAVLILFALALAACGGAGLAANDAIQSAGEPTADPGESTIAGMNLGEVQLLDFGSGGQASIAFNSEAASGTYVALVNSFNVREGDFTLTLQGDLVGTAGLVLASPPQAGETGEAPVFEDEGESDNPMHDMMQAWAPYYAESNAVDTVPEPSGTLQAAQSAFSVGSTRSFRVLNSLTSVSSYETVEGRLRYMGSNILVYVDTEMDDSFDLTDSDIQGLASSFEDNSLPVEREFFGDESDINNDGMISILMTPVLNRFCQASGIVTGFFFPGDLYARTAGNPASNEEEIFFTLVPDSLGQFCRPLSTEFTMGNILPGVLAHEWQHMASFNQHVFVHQGVTEEAYLNEALSHLAEDLVGHGNENYARIKIFLDRLTSTTLIPAGSPSLAERGMSYMFLRYLYEQASDATSFLNDIVQTDLRGVDNLEAAFLSNDLAIDELEEMLTYWQVALMVTGTGLSDDPRYNYQERTLHPVTGNYQGICLHCDTNDGRGTVLTGPTLLQINALPSNALVESAGLRFFQIEGPGSELVISGSSGSQLSGALIRLEDAQ